ncbi:MAG: hypothetical protein AB3N28_03065 [Kordiimonas sp.]
MRYFIITIFAFLSSSISAAPSEQLKALSPFIGTWTSVDGSVDGSNSFQDIAKWEWAFDGKVVRITHSVNKGAYAGESLIHWDDVQGKIIYRYVNTASFYTDGTITPKDDGSIDVHEFVRGSKTGPTESLSNYRVENGQLRSWAKFKTDGKWAEPNDVVYNSTPDATLTINN